MMYIVKRILFLLILSSLLINGCQEQPEIDVPKNLGNFKLSNVILGEEASATINKLHGLSVAADKNIIAEYGEEKKDLLYISYYKETDKAEKLFRLMMDKMIQAKKSPFTHIQTIAAYNNQVYIVLGMGAYHYIYNTQNYILWLQTYQKFGRKLPSKLIELYPVLEKIHNL